MLIALIGRYLVLSRKSFTLSAHNGSIFIQANYQLPIIQISVITVISGKFLAFRFRRFRAITAITAIL